MNRQKSLGFRPFSSLFKKEVTRFSKVLGQTLLTPLVNNGLYIIIFGLSIGERIGTMQNYPYLHFIIPGLIIMGVINNAFQNSSSSILVSKFHGDLEDLKVAPLTAVDIVGAYSLAALVRGVLIGAVIFLLGQFTVYLNSREFLSIYSPFYFIFFLFFGGISFAQVGLVVGFLSKNIEQISLFTSFILLPLSYLGGVFFSLDDLAPFWQGLAKFNPIFYFINGIKFGMLGVRDVHIDQAIGACLSFCLLSFIGAVISVKKGSYSKW